MKIASINIVTIYTVVKTFPNNCNNLLLSRHYKVVYTCHKKICGEHMYIYTGYPPRLFPTPQNKYKS